MSGIKIDFLGATKLGRKLKEFQKISEQETIKAVKLSTLAVHGEAIKSINAHLSTGITYGRHTASKPGYPPNTDTGRLVGSIKWEFEDKGMVGIVGTNLDYGKMLEFGTSKIAERPWLSRAYYEKQKEILELINNVYNEAVKKVSK